MKPLAVPTALLLLTSSVVSAQEMRQDVPISGKDSRYRLIGKLQEPLESGR